MTTNLLPDLRHVVANVGNGHMDFRDGHVDIRDGDMSAHDQLGLKWDSKQLLGGGGDRTHVKNMKDPVEDQFPSGDGLFILIHVEKSRASGKT